TRRSAPPRVGDFSRSSRARVIERASPPRPPEALARPSPPLEALRARVSRRLRKPTQPLGRDLDRCSPAGVRGRGHPTRAPPEALGRHAPSAPRRRACVTVGCTGRTVQPRPCSLAAPRSTCPKGHLVHRRRRTPPPSGGP